MHRAHRQIVLRNQAAGHVAPVGHVAPIVHVAPVGHVAPIGHIAPVEYVVPAAHVRPAGFVMGAMQPILMIGIFLLVMLYFGFLCAISAPAMKRRTAAGRVREEMKEELEKGRNDRLQDMEEIKEAWWKTQWN